MDLLILDDVRRKEVEDVPQRTQQKTLLLKGLDQPGRSRVEVAGLSLGFQFHHCQSSNPANLRHSRQPGDAGQARREEFFQSSHSLQPVFLIEQGQAFQGDGASQGVGGIGMSVQEAPPPILAEEGLIQALRHQGGGQGKIPSR